jgi:hypothetical protein
MIHPFIPHALAFLLGPAMILAAVLTWSRSTALIAHVSAGLMVMVVSVCYAAAKALSMAGAKL